MQSIIYTLTITLVCFILSPAYSQTPEVHSDDGICISKEMYQQIHQQIAENRKALIKSGKLSQNRNAMPPMFIWPLRQAPHFDYHGFYAISNYVDQDPSGNIQDYNCGTRTYNGHNGTDVRTAPFRWNKMADDDVEIIAAAPGVIINKTDGNTDQSCAWGSGIPWNAVFVEHADGTITWYGHMKNGSTTPKDTGEMVVAGEYLGLVGSSGNSTGAHLHFEVYDPGGNLIDPFQGTCNNLNNESWWLNQLPYFDSGVNRMMTASQAWTSPPCPQVSQLFLKDVFDQGDSIIFSVHFRNDNSGNTAQITAFEPDGDTSSMLNVMYTAPGFSTSNSILYRRALSNGAPQGKWTFEAVHTTASYGTDAYEINFWVAQDCQANPVFAGTHSTDRYYKASNTITSTATVGGAVHVVYDAENVTTLLPGFIAPVGSKLEIKTAGCN